mmetsp:Transcript_10920/g.19600  ORF Transcript_10920/g.19600 Transcript_10920/m.19600 type:complete len:84 (+) Transcript_10920:535-786(+)
MAGSLSVSDSCMQQYIRYYFEKKVVNLQKTKKNELQAILTLMIEHHYSTIRTTSALIADMWTLDTTTVSPDENSAAMLVLEAV